MPNSHYSCCSAAAVHMAVHDCKAQCCSAVQLSGNSLDEEGFYHTGAPGASVLSNVAADPAQLAAMLHPASHT